MAWWDDDRDLYDGDGWSFEPRPKTCRFCGVGGGEWASAWMPEEGRYRYFLTIGGTTHNCRTARPDEFEDLTHADPQTDSTSAAHRPANRPGHAEGSRRPAARRAPEAARFGAKRAAGSRS